MITITRKRPIDLTITERSTPIASLPIFATKHRVRSVGDHLYSGIVDVSPDILEFGQSYSIEKCRIKIYSDGSGKHYIPPEWREKGVTVVGDVYDYSGQNHYSFLVREND